MRLLSRLESSGLAITSVLPRGGKTVVTAAIARTQVRQGVRVGVCKLIDTRCVRRREGLVSEDAEMLAACAESSDPLDLICPVRYANAEPAPIAAERAHQPIDFDAINRSLRIVSGSADVTLIKSPASAADPIGERTSFIEAAVDLAIPVVLVIPATIEHAGLVIATVRAFRAAGVVVAGMVMNRYSAEDATVEQESNLRSIERWTGASLLAVVPEEAVRNPVVPPGILSAIGRVDWQGIAGAR